MGYIPSYINHSLVDGEGIMEVYSLEYCKSCKEVITLSLQDVIAGKRVCKDSAEKGLCEECFLGNITIKELRKLISTRKIGMASQSAYEKILNILDRIIKKQAL